MFVICLKLHVDLFNNNTELRKKIEVVSTKVLKRTKVLMPISVVYNVYDLVSYAVLFWSWRVFIFQPIDTKFRFLI